MVQVLGTVQRSGESVVSDGVAAVKVGAGALVGGAVGSVLGPVGAAVGAPVGATAFNRQFNKGTAARGAGRILVVAITGAAALGLMSSLLGGGGGQV